MNQRKRTRPNSTTRSPSPKRAREDSFCLFGGLTNDEHDHILFREFSFTVKTLSHSPRSDSFQSSRDCFAFGKKLFDLAKQSDTPTEGSNLNALSFRPCFHQHNVVTRLSFFLLDTTAFLTTSQMDAMEQDFDAIFRPQPTGRRGQRIRLITTGMIRAILYGFATQIYKYHTKGVFLKQIINHTRLSTQQRWILDYVQMATALIEIFYYRNVRIYYNPSSRFGLINNRAIPLVAEHNAEFICTSLDLITNATTTRTAIPTGSNGSRQMEEQLTGHGIFGATFYMNSILPTDNPSILNCTVVTSTQVTLSLFNVSNNTHSEYTHPDLRISIAEIIPNTRNLYPNDILLWQYNFAHYATQRNQYSTL